MKGEEREYKDEARQPKTKPSQGRKVFFGTCIYQGPTKSGCLCLTLEND